MEISKIGTNLVQNVKSYASNPIKRIAENIGNGTNLAPLKKDTLELKTQTQKFIDKLDYEYPRANVKINGQDYTKFEYSRYGSNPAFWAIDNKTGELYYIKSSKLGNTEQLKEEVAATNLYKLAGFDTPEVDLCKLDDGTVAIRSKYTPGLETIKVRKDVVDGYAADAWLANWDSVLNDNTMVKDGKAFKIDNGGALRYRAQGALKPNFGDKVDELTTLIDGRNRDSAYIYNEMSKEDLIKSFKRVCEIKDSDIKKVVKDKELAQTLINRKEYMNDLLCEIEQTPYTQKRLIDYMKHIVK